MSKKFISLFLLFWLSFIIKGNSLIQKKQNQKSEKKEDNFLVVRKDLLNWEKDRLEFPIRNIFSSHQPVLEKNSSKKQKTSLDSPSTKSSSESSSVNIFIDLTYLGYVLSKEKIVGLVIFQGETIPVEKGDIISEGIEIEEITPQQIVIKTTDRGKRSFPLQGEEL